MSDHTVSLVCPGEGRTARLRALAGRLGLALATGVIFTFYSELAFWARPTEGTQIPELWPTILLYAFAAYAFLTTVSVFRVVSADALFLAGAVYGWLIEGVFVQTMYEDFPLNLSWTGLAWHALITVLFGWHALPEALHGSSARKPAALAAAAGVVYGLWAVWWWIETPPSTPPMSFAGYAALTTALLGAAHAIGSRLPLATFTPSRLEIAVLGVVIGAYFIGITLPAQPLAALVLPPLAGAALLTLRRNAQRESRLDLVAQSLQRGVIPPRRLLALALVPVTATAVYALAFTLDLRPSTGMLLYLITTPLGFVLFVRSVFRIWRPAAAAAPSVST